MTLWVTMATQDVSEGWSDTQTQKRNRIQNIHTCSHATVFMHVFCVLVLEKKKHCLMEEHEVEAKLAVYNVGTPSNLPKSPPSTGGQSLKDSQIPGLATWISQPSQPWGQHMAFSAMMSSSRHGWMSMACISHKCHSAANWELRMNITMVNYYGQWWLMMVNDG